MNYNLNYRPQIPNSLHPQQVAALQAQIHYSNAQQQQATQSQQGNNVQLQQQFIPHPLPEGQTPQQTLAMGNIPQQQLTDHHQQQQHFVNRATHPSPVQHFHGNQQQSNHTTLSQSQQQGVIPQAAPHMQVHQHPLQMPAAHPNEAHTPQFHLANQLQPGDLPPKQAKNGQQNSSSTSTIQPSGIPISISTGQGQIQPQIINVPTPGLVPGPPPSSSGLSSQPVNQPSSAKSARFPVQTSGHPGNGTQQTYQRPLSATNGPGSANQPRVVPITPFNANSTMSLINYKKQMSNLATLRFLDFCELVGVRSESVKNILYWKKIVTDYFSEIGTMRYSVKSGMDSRQFEFSVPIIPRFFFSIIQSGVTRLEIHPGMMRTQVLANGMTYLESSRSCFTHYYSDGSYVKIYGTIKGILNQSLKLDWLDFQTHVFIPGLEWPSLEKLIGDEAKIKQIFPFDNASSASKLDKSESKDDEKSESIRKTQVLQNFRSNYQVFHSMSNFGLQESVMRVLQVSDVMAHLKSLMLFSLHTDQAGPLSSLDNYVDEFYNKSKNEDNMKKKAKANDNLPSSSAAGSGIGSGSATTPSGSGNGNSTKQNPSSLPGKDNPSSRGSPGDMSNSSQGNSPLTRGKVPTLDMSQSTLTKRRRKSTVGDLSPKSLADQPHSPKSTGKVANKKTKR